MCARHVIIWAALSAMAILPGCHSSPRAADDAGKKVAQPEAYSEGESVRFLSALPADGTRSTEADRKGRLAIKRGTDYVPIGEDPKQLFDRLEQSMAERRKIGWRIVEAMLAPQKLPIDGQVLDVPLWHTWYEGGRPGSGNAEVNAIIDLYVENLKQCRDEKCQETSDQIATRTLTEYSTKDLAESLTKANMNQRLTQHSDPALVDPSDKFAHLGRGFTIFSPSFVEHVLTQARGIETCLDPKQSAATPPRSATQFSHCIDEFPPSAVMVKTEWFPIDQDNRTFDTSGAALERQLSTLNGRWTAGSSKARTTDNIYAVKTDDALTYGLNAIHFSTKDTREWIWVTLWWDPQPANDFGADRPASIGKYNQGVWKNYKMCVVTAFDERDQAPWKAYEKDQPSLAAAIRGSSNAMTKVAKESPVPFNKVASWCSNPFLETHVNNDKTNCIGCHQYSVTYTENPKIRPARATGFADTLWILPGQQPILEGDRADYARSFPQLGRSRIRMNFPADFAWSTRIEFPGQITDARKHHKFEW